MAQTGHNEREKTMKLSLNMVFLFCTLLVAWNLQDSGQPMAGALLVIVSLALSFLIQIEKN
jgi:fatty-acid desaturase